MINKIISFCFILILMIGCKKEQSVPISIKDGINNLFNLKKYRKISQREINDSVFIFEGENERFSIKGQYNFIKNYRTGWWKSYDIKNKEKYLDVEFFKEVDKKKESNNQIIFYKNNKVDTVYSKFYTKEIKDNKTVLYNFYFPKSLDKFYSAKINLGIISNEKPLLYPTDFKSERIKSGNYRYLLDMSKYRKFKHLNVIGLFSEYSRNDLEKKMGISEIFINDTIQIK